MDSTIVVGVDESAAGMQAVDLAALEARIRGARLHIVHACIYPGLHEPWSSRADFEPTHRLQKIMAAAARRAEVVSPGLQVTTDIFVGDAVGTLVKTSENAEAVVVGSHGFGGFAELLIGSTAVELAAHAHVPVFVHRGRHDPEGPVLVGVDGGPTTESVVGFAFAEASFRHADLLAVHAWDRWTSPVNAGLGDDSPALYETNILRDGAERMLAEAVAGWQERYPDVSVHRRSMHAHSRAALIGASGESQLVVVGPRGRGGFPGLLLGSVTDALLHHSLCPVAIVRP